MAQHNPGHDLHKSIDAACALRHELAKIVAGDTPDDLQALQDTFNGETTLDVEIRRAVLAIEEDEILVSGISAREKELKGRRLRLEKRIEATRGLIEQAMTIAAWPSYEMDIGTVTLGKAAPHLEVYDESSIPTQFWKASDPTLDKSGLTKLLRERLKALNAVQKIKDPDDRAAAMRGVDKDFPPIDGARLESEGLSLTIRRS